MTYTCRERFCVLLEFLNYLHPVRRQPSPAVMDVHVATPKISNTRRMPLIYPTENIVHPTANIDQWFKRSVSRNPIPMPRIARILRWYSRLHMAFLVLAAFLASSLSILDPLVSTAFRAA